MSSTPAEIEANPRSGNPAKKAVAKATAGRKVAIKKPQDHNGAAPAITIDAEPQKKVTVRLIGVDYTIATPKASLAIRITQQARDPARAENAYDALQTWIDVAFGKQAAAVRERLDDPADALDLTHIMQLMNALIEVDAPDPTT